MRKIISSIDIGSDSIKFVVGEIYDNRLHILSASKIPNVGIERGKIVNENAVVTSIKKAIEEASNTLGVKVEKCILGLNMTNAKLSKSATAIKIKGEESIISGEDVNTILTKCADGKIPSDHMLVGVIPVEFTIDNDKVVKRPLGVKSENLGLKAIIVSSPRDYVGAMLDIANKSGLKVIDVVSNAVGDYYSFRTSSMDEKVGAIVNLGAEASTVSIFNKGIITNTNTFPLGAKNIVRDIAFVNKIDESDAEAIYKDLVLANSKLANPNEYRIVLTIDGEEIKLNQFDISEIASSRIEEILNLAKKQINILTKKEISYIIVSGGLTELRDFSLSLEAQFGKDANVGKLNLIGVRDNSYSSAVGNIKYFSEKLELKGKAFSIFSSDELEDMNSGGREVNTGNESLFGKVFGYFFDN